MSDTPDYAALVKLLPTLRNLVDGCGDVSLTDEEAELIRSLGFAAQSGRWRVPPVPPELVRDNPLLENRSIGWSSRQNDPPASSVRIPEARVEGSRVAVQDVPATEGARPGEFRRTKEPSARLRQARGGDDSEVSALAAKILVSVKRNGGEITKRRLQQNLWRYQATTFNKALKRLAKRGQIILDRKP